MSGDNGRRFPNFSQYLDDLNTIPSPYDQALQQQQQQDSFNLDAELALFTNTEFFDFDSFGDFSLPTFDSVENDNSNKGAVPKMEQNSDMKFLDLLNEGLPNVNNFSSDYNTLNTQNIPLQDTSYSAFPPAPSAPVNTNLAPAPQQPSLPTPQSTSAQPAKPSAPASTPASKRKQAQKSGNVSVEEAAQIAAEEDKRRRNTAASARFRVKKKLREQTLEKTVKDTTARNAALEARVSQLEVENQWLKNLITDKNATSSEGKKSENDIAEMFQKFLASQKSEGQSSSPDSKSGVATTA